jgi:hypothetical protein
VLVLVGLWVDVCCVLPGLVGRGVVELLLLVLVVELELELEVEVELDDDDDDDVDVELDVVPVDELELDVVGVVVVVVLVVEDCVVVEVTGGGHGTPSGVVIVPEPTVHVAADAVGIAARAIETNTAAVSARVLRSKRLFRNVAQFLP